MDREAWWATVHRVAKSRTGLSDYTFFLSFGPRVSLGSRDKLTSKVINSSIQSISVILLFIVINLYLVLSVVPRSHSPNP